MFLLDRCSSVRNPRVYVCLRCQTPNHWTYRNGMSRWLGELVRLHPLVQKHHYGSSLGPKILSHNTGLVLVAKTCTWTLSCSLPYFCARLAGPFLLASRTGSCFDRWQCLRRTSLQMWDLLLKSNSTQWIVSPGPTSAELTVWRKRWPQEAGGRHNRLGLHRM